MSHLQTLRSASGSIDAFRTTGPSPTSSDASDATLGSSDGLHDPVIPPPLPVVPSVRDGVVPLPDIVLEHGAVLRDGRLAFRVWGPADAPAVLVLGGISAGRDAAPAHGSDCGWWSAFIGSGLAVDTERYSVIAIDWLGGRGDSTPAQALPCSPARNGARLPGGASADEPLLTPGDQAAAIISLLDALGVSRLHACIGASYGGMVALSLAAHFPARLARLVILGAAHEPHPMATAVRSLQRSIVRNGIATGDVRSALILARALGITTYRTAREFASRFTPGEGNASPVEDYLLAQGERFADRFSAASYLCLSQSIDLHRVDPAAVRMPSTVVAFDPDAIAPVWQARVLTASLSGPWSLRVLPSIYGHDAFLKEIAAITPIVRDALGRDAVSR